MRDRNARDARRAATSVDDGAQPSTTPFGACCFMKPNM